MRARSLPLALLASFWACGTPTPAPDSGTTPPLDTAVADAPAGVGDTPTAPEPDAPTAETTVDIAADPNCPPISGWQAGTPAFALATSEWGLEGVMGIRMSVTDLDGDGWPDLLVRNGGGPDDFGPEGNRSRWVLRNTGQGTFEDVTEASGLLTYRFAGDDNHNQGRPGDTFTSGDVDNDGDLDIFVGHTRTDVTDLESETSELMLNNGDGTFSLGPKGSYSRFQYVASKPAGIAFLDYDLDGQLDLWVVHNQQPGPTGLPDYLLHGDGAGSFENAIWDMGVTSKPWSDLDDLNGAKAYTWGWSGAACDLNNDGLPELLAASYGRFPNQLWRAIPGAAGGAASYENISVASGYAFDHRVDWTDNVSAQCHCEDFPDDADCDTVPSPPSAALCESFVAAFGGYRWNHATGREPFNLGGNSATTVCADVDNDGWMDLMTGEIVHWDVGSSSDPAELLFNTRDPAIRFERPGNDVTGLVRVDEYEGWDHGDMTAAVFDFDNDGWQDVYIGSSDYPGNKSLLFRQTAPAEFEHVAIADYFLHYPPTASPSPTSTGTETSTWSPGTR